MKNKETFRVKYAVEIQLVQILLKNHRGGQIAHFRRVVQSSYLGATTHNKAEKAYLAAHVAGAKAKQ